MYRKAENEEVHALLEGPRQTRRNWRILVGVGLAIIGSSATTAWWTVQHMPISHDPKTELQVLEAQASKRSGRSPQSVWAQVKKELGVARIEEIRRWDLDAAKEALRRVR
ncbi:MAG: hypothetical protein HQL56_05675 [Magnetococcales bacterium]|nr:hypothetical protein [Magnetococcales bacterium]